jgi:glycerophosphoryl diester phosphodiesterase
MRLIAHRGFADEHAENTLPAFRAAARIADGVELDARRCGSGDVVVVHDERIDRLAGSQGRVRDLTAAALADLDVLGSGAGVPTLRAVFEALPDEAAVNLELKEQGLAADAIAVAADHPAEVFVSAFEPDILREARGADSAVPLAYLFDDPAGIDPVTTALDLDCAYLHPHHEACDAALVEAAHAAGLRVNAWTVPDAATARRLHEAGVDGIIADAPDVLKGAGDPER